MSVKDDVKVSNLLPEKELVVDNSCRIRKTVERTSVLAVELAVL